MSENTDIIIDKDLIMSKNGKNKLIDYFDQLGGDLDKIIGNIRKFDSPPDVASKFLKVLKSYKGLTNQEILEEMKNIGQIGVGIICSMEREIITEVTKNFKTENPGFEELSDDYELKERELSDEEKNQLDEYKNELGKKREKTLKEFYEETVNIDDIISQKFSKDNIEEFNEKLASYLKEDSVNTVDKENFTGDFFIDTINRGSPYLMKKICNKLDGSTIDVMAENILENPKIIRYSRIKNFMRNDSERRIIKKLLEKIKNKCKDNVKQIAEEIVKISDFTDSIINEIFFNEILNDNELAKEDILEEIVKQTINFEDKQDKNFKLVKEHTRGAKLLDLLIYDINGKFAEKILSMKENDYEAIGFNGCNTIEEKFKVMELIIRRYYPYNINNKATLASNNLELAYNRILNGHDKKQDNLIQKKEKEGQEVKPMEKKEVEDNEIVTKETNKEEEKKKGEKKVKDNEIVTKIDTKNKDSLIENWKMVMNEFKKKIKKKKQEVQEVKQMEKKEVKDNEIVTNKTDKEEEKEKGEKEVKDNEIVTKIDTKNHRIVMEELMKNANIFKKIKKNLEGLTFTSFTKRLAINRSIRSQTHGR